MSEDGKVLSSLQMICDHLSDRTAALFLGAGVNAGLFNGKGEEFPLGQGLSKEPRPAGRGFCKPRGNLSPLRYELPFLPALPSGASWQIFVNGYAGIF